MLQSLRSEVLAICFPESSDEHNRGFIQHFQTMSPALRASAFFRVHVDETMDVLEVLHKSFCRFTAHRHLSLLQSSSASRFTAGAAGFLNFSQSLHLPLR